MNEKPDFAELLSIYMDRQIVGDARLATLVQQRFGHIVSIHRSTIRNWRSGTSQSVTDWQQLIAVAAALNLTALEADQLLEAVHLPSLAVLWGMAQGEEQRLLQQWTEPASSSASKDKSLYIPPFVLPVVEVPFFTGRETELLDLEKALLTSEGPRVAGIVGLTGIGGMGKSALAFHFARTYRQRFPDGVIGLRIDGQQLDTVARRFAHFAGVEIETNQKLSPAEIMQSVFQHKRALLIFDNAEESAAKVLKPDGDQCAVIVTTRNRGLLRGFGIPPIAQVDLQRFQLDETRRLLAQIIGESRVAAEPEAVHDIHDLIGGLPLAIRIVGGTLADQTFTTLAAYATLLHTEKTRLLSHLKDRDDRDLDVRASFEASLKYLNDTEKRLFACLGVCAPEGFALTTVQAVAEEETSVRDALGRLVRLSLVSESAVTERFILHPLIHLFAGELAQQLGMLEPAEQRHTAYFRQYADEHKELSPANMEALASELDALLLTAKRLTDHQMADYGYWRSLEPFLQTRGYWRQALDLIERFLSVARSIDDPYAVTQFLLQRGQFLQLQGKWAETEQSLRESENAARQIRNERQRERSLAMVLNSLGGVYQRQGNFDAAVTAFQQSAVIEEKLGNERGQAIVLNSLGGVYQRQGNFYAAVQTFQQSAVIEAKLGNKRGQAMILNSLGGVYQRQGNFDAASTAFQQSYDLLVKLGDERGQAMVLNSLGGVYQRQGNFDAAVHALQQSADIEAKSGNERGQAMVLNSLGGVYQRQGNFDDAVHAFQQSYDISSRLNDERSLAMVLNSLGGVYQRQGNFDAAVHAFQRSAQIGEELGDMRHLAMVLNSLGGVYQRLGNFDAAGTAFQQSYDLLVKLGDERGQAMVLNSLGGVYQRQGNFDAAVHAFQQSYDISSKLNDERSLAMVLNSLGGVYQRLGNFDAAGTAFQQSYDVPGKLSDERSLAMVLNSLGGVQQRQGNFDAAVHAFQQSYAIEEKLGDERGQAMVLNSLGGVYQRQGNFDAAAHAFQQSAQIGEELGDMRHFAMVLNSLGGVYQRQGNFDAAVQVLQQSVVIEEKNGNKRGQAMVLNSLGGVYQRQGNFDAAVQTFQQSYNISERLDDKLSMAMVTFSFGKAFLENNKIKEARSNLTASFEINETLRIAQGMRIVTPSLVRALTILGQFSEAQDVCRRALTIAPEDKRLLRIQEQLELQHKVDSHSQRLSGHIKRLIRNLSGYQYGFITPNGGGEDVYFGEDQVDEALMPQLAEGIAVMAEVEVAARGLRARRVWCAK